MAYQFIDSGRARSYDAGRGGKKIDRIVIHHWGTRGQQFESVIHWFLYDAPTSAHYVAEAGRVQKVVGESDTAWHAGIYDINQRSIGIECRPEATDGDYETVGELVCDIWRRYGKIPLTRHKDYVATDCPGAYDIERIRRIAEKYYSGAAPRDTLPKDTVPKPDLLRVQVGAYRVKENADAMEKKLQERGYDTYLKESGGLYRVQVGAYKNVQNAAKMAEKLRADGFDTYIVGKGIPDKEKGIDGVSGYRETGTFYPNDVINVRRAPSTDGEVVAQYHPGESVTYDSVYITGGYVWISYIGASGKRNYMACRTYQNGVRGALWGHIE